MTPRSVCFGDSVPVFIDVFIDVCIDVQAEAQLEPPPDYEFVSDAPTTSAQVRFDWSICAVVCNLYNCLGRTILILFGLI